VLTALVELTNGDDQTVGHDGQTKDVKHWQEQMSNLQVPEV